jgi:hypothetical protein
MRWLLVLVVSSCGVAPMRVDGGVADVPDASSGTPDAGQPLRLVLGTGAPGAFATVTNGQQLPLQRGCQGSQHIFFSLRAWGVTQARPRLTLAIEDGSGRQVSSPYSLQLPFEPVANADFVQWTGLTPVVEEPGDVVGKTVTLRARIDDGATNTSDERTITVQWGPDACRPHP